MGKAQHPEKADRCGQGNPQPAQSGVEEAEHGSYGSGCGCISAGKRLVVAGDMRFIIGNERPRAINGNLQDLGENSGNSKIQNPEETSHFVLRMLSPPANRCKDEQNRYKEIALAERSDDLAPYKNERSLGELKKERMSACIHCECRKQGEGCQYRRSQKQPPYRRSLQWA